jgi:hypothetical protein
MIQYWLLFQQSNSWRLSWNSSLKVSVQTYRLCKLYRKPATIHFLLQVFFCHFDSNFFIVRSSQSTKKGKNFENIPEQSSLSLDETKAPRWKQLLADAHCKQVTACALLATSSYLNTSKNSHSIQHANDFITQCPSWSYQRLSHLVHAHACMYIQAWRFQNRNSIRTFYHPPPSCH